MKELLELLVSFSDQYWWLWIILIPLIIWGRICWNILHDHEKKPESFEWAIDLLKTGRYGQLYLKILKTLLDKISGFVGDTRKFDLAFTTQFYPKSWVDRAFGFNPWTVESYKINFILAIYYPLLSLIIFWVWKGNDVGKLIGVSFLYDDFSSPTSRLLFLITLIAIIFIIARIFQLSFLGKVASTITIITLLIIFTNLKNLDIFSELIRSWGLWGVAFFPTYLGIGLINLSIYRSWRQAHNSIFDIAFLISIILLLISIFIDFHDEYRARTFINASALAVAISVVGLVLGANAITGFFASILVGVTTAMIIYYKFRINDETMTISISVFIATSFYLLNKKCYYIFKDKYNKENLYWILYSILFLGIAFYILFLGIDSTFSLVMLFLMVLPLVNVQMDWLSTGVTRGLLQAIRTGHHGIKSTLAWLMADILLALVFFMGISSIISIALASSKMVDLSMIFRSLRCTPNAVENYWVYFLIFSTLVPTLIHFSIAGGAATLWAPQHLRHKIAKNLEKNHIKLSGAWVYLTLTPFLGFVITPILLLGALYWLLTNHGSNLGISLLDMIHQLILFTHPESVVNYNSACLK